MNPDKMLEIASKYVDDNLVQLCHEQLELQCGDANSDELPHITKLRDLCAFSGYSAVRMAEGMIATAAMNRLVVNDQADIDMESYKRLES